MPVFDPDSVQPEKISADYGEIEVSRRLIAQNADCKIRIDNQIGTVSSLSKEEIYQILENLDIVTDVQSAG